MLRPITSARCLAFLLAGASPVRPQAPQIEQARQLQSLAPGAAAETPARIVEQSVSDFGETGDEESFGIQQLLKEQERLRYWRITPEFSVFTTSNVALTRRDPRRDSFLLALFPVEYRRPLGQNWQISLDARYAAFRYEKFRELNFNSVDAGVGVTYHMERLGGVDWFARYNFNALMNASSGDRFFTNHTFLLGVQKTVAFSQAHYGYSGISAQLGVADPKEAERHEFTTFLGYHLQWTRSLELDLLYRLACYRYSESDRSDLNQTISLGLRYRFNDYLSAFASSYAVLNRSEQDIFSYDAGNAGAGLSLKMDF